MPEQMKLVVFDCDGTLVDSQHAIINCMHTAFEREDLPRPLDEEIRRIVGLPLRDAIVSLHPGISSFSINRIKESYSKAWVALRESAKLNEPLYPKAVEILEHIKCRGWKLGIATGKSHRGLKHTLEINQILDYFQTLQTADRSQGKPYPDMLIKAMEEVEAVPANTVMIGDTTFDMEMAQNAGVLAIGVAWGYHPGEELIKSGARTVIHSYPDLPMTLDSFL